MLPVASVPPPGLVIRQRLSVRPGSAGLSAARFDEGALRLRSVPRFGSSKRSVCCVVASVAWCRHPLRPVASDVGQSPKSVLLGTLIISRRAALELKSRRALERLVTPRGHRPR